MGSQKSSSAPAPERVTAEQTAAETMNARLAQDPRAAQLWYDIQSNPNYGLGATTQMALSARDQAYAQEAGIKNQLLQNIMNQLLSPTGLTPEQQSATDALRNQSILRQQEAMRNRANLGGGLYGGRNQVLEQQGVNELLNQFTTSDIARQDTLRQNALQTALSALSQLYPQVGLQYNQYASPVASGENVYQGNINQRQTDMNWALEQQKLAAQQQANQNQLYSALLQGAGTAVGGFLGGPLGASLGSSLAKIGSGNQPGTGFMGGTLGGATQSEILGFPTARYQ